MRKNTVASVKRITKKIAFTLAEVIIVVGIIGIVAEMTIPTLVNKIETAKNVAMLKKMYSTLSSAYSLAVQENGTPDQWGLIAIGDSTGLANFNNIMSTQLRVSKNCGTSSGCFISSGYVDLNKIAAANIDTNAGYSKLVLVDGSYIALRQWNGDCSWNWGSSAPLQSVCGMITVDTNGLTQPNKYGVDYFGFLLTKNGIIPIGGPAQSTYPYTDYCNRTKSSDASWKNGLSCTAWVIYNENMDYLNCDDLSWSGKKKCS